MHRHRGKFLSLVVCFRSSFLYQFSFSLKAFIYLREKFVYKYIPYKFTHTYAPSVSCVPYVIYEFMIEIYVYLVSMLLQYVRDPDYHSLYCKLVLKKKKDMDTQKRNFEKYFKKMLNNLTPYVGIF